MDMFSSKLPPLLLMYSLRSPSLQSSRIMYVLIFFIFFGYFCFVFCFYFVTFNMKKTHYVGRLELFHYGYFIVETFDHVFVFKTRHIHTFDCDLVTGFDMLTFVDFAEGTFAEEGLLGCVSF